MVKLEACYAIVPLGDIGLNAAFRSGQSSAIQLEREDLSLHFIIDRKMQAVMEHRAIAVFVLCHFDCLLSFLSAGKVASGPVGKSNER
jgi:hypothetical protein